jgi:hypothetical protein
MIETLWLHHWRRRHGARRVQRASKRVRRIAKGQFLAAVSFSLINGSLVPGRAGPRQRGPAKIVRRAEALGRSWWRTRSHTLSKGQDFLFFRGVEDLVVLQRVRARRSAQRCRRHILPRRSKRRDAPSKVLGGRPKARCQSLALLTGVGREARIRVAATQRAMTRGGLSSLCGRTWHKGTRGLKKGRVRLGLVRIRVRKEPIKRLQKK